MPPQDYTNDEFELNNHHENKTFQSEKNEQNFTDFTGSREVGIDVGDDMTERRNNLYAILSELDDKKPTQIENINDDNNLKVKSISNSSFKHSNLNINLEEVKEEEEEIENPFYLNINNNEMTRDDFDKFLDTRFSEILDDKNIQEIFSKSNQPNLIETEKEDEYNNNENNDVEDEDGDEENDSELNTIFNKDNIEKNLPELFGSVKLEQSITSTNYDRVKNEIDKRYAKESTSRVSAPLGFVSSKSNFEPESDSLSTSSIISTDLNNKNWNVHFETNPDDISLKSEDIDDYKTIQSSAFKNLRIQSNNNFFLNDSQKGDTLKDYINNEKKTIKIVDDFLTSM